MSNRIGESPAVQDPVSNLVEQIAKIERTFLGYEDHGIFTVSLTLDYGGGGHQGAGSACLDTPLKDEDGKFLRRVGTRMGHDYIIGIIRACGVDSWEQIKGRTVIALREHGYHSSVIGIKPLPTEPGTEFIFASVFDTATAPQSPPSPSSPSPGEVSRG